MNNYTLIQQHPSGKQDILKSYKDKIDAEKYAEKLQRFYAGFERIKITFLIKKEVVNG